MAAPKGEKEGHRMMSERSDRVRPYAATGNVTDLLKRYRSLNLPQAIDKTDLRTAGIPEPNISRTYAALRFLGLLSDANEPTDAWRALANSPPDDYQAQLAALLRSAYADVFSRVDPAEDSQQQVRQAFQPYEPKSQLDRMVSFFLGMCAEAGIATLDAPKRRPTKAQALRSRSRAPAVMPKVTTNGRAKDEDAHTTEQPRGHTATEDRRVPPPLLERPDYAVVHAVVKRLPAGAAWSTAERDKWLAAIRAAVDLEVEINEGEVS